MKDGRGNHMTRLKHENKQRIKEYSDSHPDALMKDACKALGISGVTLARHLKEINKESKSDG